MNALNSYGFGNSKPPGFSATEHIDANDLNTGSRKPPGFSLPSTSMPTILTGSRNTIDEAYYPSQPEGFGVQNFGVGGNANASNRNFNLNDNFPGINSAVNQKPMLSAESVSYTNANDLSGNGQRNQRQTQRDKKEATIETPSILQSASAVP